MAKDSSNPANPEGRAASPLGWHPVWFASILSAVAGVLVAVLIPSQFTLAIRLEPSGGQLDPANLVHWKSALRDSFTDAGVFGLVDSPSPNSVRALIKTTRRRDGEKALELVSRGFQIKLTELSQRLKAERSPLETVLLDESAQLRERLALMQQKLDEAGTALPPSDPRVNRDALRLRWEALRADWASANNMAQSASTEIERLRAAPDLSSGQVAEADRQAAIVGDPALQQDLKEVNVRLTEIKLHLLQVWQLSAGRLEQLAKETAAFKETLAGVDVSKFSAGVRAGVDALRVALDAYSVTLASFQNAWTTEFTTVQRMTIDPRDPVLIDLQERVRKMLGDFLFKGSKQLGDLREKLGAPQNADGAAARQHVLESTLTRGFQTVQTAHHRFEFAASMIETPENFRLDASLRSARGLGRRIREQIQSIEKRLEVEAAARAKAERQRALAEAEQTIEQLRVQSQRTVTELFNVQDGLLAAGMQTQDFLLAALRVEVIAQTVQTMQRDLADLEARRSELESHRLQQAGEQSVKALTVETLKIDWQWGLRIRLGLIAGVMIFLAVFAMRKQAAPRVR